MHSFSLVIIGAVFGFVLCDEHHIPTSQSPNSLSEDLQDIAENAKKMLDDGSKRLSEDVVDMGTKVKDAMEDLLEKEFNLDFDAQDNTTEFEGIDASGCDRGLLKKLETKCDNVYDQVNEEAQLIEDERSKTEAVCCALEDFERCSLRAYDDANCSKDKAAIRENLKAARLFLSVVANITCTEFRDANGCNRCILKNMEAMCKKVYDQEYDAAQLIEDEGEKTQLIYWADEKFGNCTLQAYDNANCVKDTSDVTDCKFGWFQNMTTKCFKAFIQDGISVDLIEDEREKRKGVCCAFENYEKCIVRAYDDANCEKSKAFLLYLRLASNFTCTEFGSQCLINTTAASENAIDANGCNRGLLKNLETKCNNTFDQVSNAAQLIEDKRKKAKVVCCALEDLEKCSVQAYAHANCTKDKAGIKKNLKEAGLFLCGVADVTCT